MHPHIELFPSLGYDDSMAEAEFFRDIIEHGFLPPEDPLRNLPASFRAWDEIGAELPKLLTAGTARQTISEMPLLDPHTLSSPSEKERAMLILSYLGHGYVWGEASPPSSIPKSLAVPWHQLSESLGRPPVLSYSSYALHNWRRMDPSKPVELGNIVLLQNFLGGIDEEWFVLVHVDIEAKAKMAMGSLALAQSAVAKKNSEELLGHLERIASALEKMYVTLLRMTEHCDPYIYFNRVRPYLYGWKNQPALPGGLVYEGVPAYGEKPQFFRGETGAQSSIIPCLDALLGIQHKDDPLKEYLLEMRDYMPPRHRAYLAALEKGPSVRAFVETLKKEEPELRQIFNDCVKVVAMFRGKHYEYAGRYIQQQHQKSQTNPNEVGTGGTPFMTYLKKHLQETEDQRI